MLPLSCNFLFKHRLFVLSRTWNICLQSFLLTHSLPTWVSVHEKGGKEHTVKVKKTNKKKQHFQHFSTLERLSASCQTRRNKQRCAFIILKNTIRCRKSSDGISNVRETEWLHTHKAFTPACAVKSNRTKTRHSVISNDTHLSCRLVLLLFSQHTGLRQRGHRSTMPVDPE